MLSIFRAVGRFRRQLASMLLLDRALRRAQQDDRVSALRLVTQIYGVYGATPPSDQVPAFLNLSFAELSRAVGSKPAAYEACVLALRQLRDAPRFGPGRLSPDERDFLLHRCKWMLIVSTDYEDPSAIALAATIGITSRDLKPNNVSPTMKAMFTSTPEWDTAFDAWFLDNSLPAQSANDR